MEIGEQAEVQFIIEKNDGNGRGYSITENPGTIHEVVRSPFDSIEEARKRALEKFEWWGVKGVEVKSRKCPCPPNYHTMFENCRGY